MTLKEAREFRDYIHSKDSINCMVPLGFGPNGYFPRSMLSTGPHFWKTRAEFRKWLADRIRQRRRQLREYKRLTIRRARSPIELMVDRTCGLA
jgi:hypothetical protein